VAEAEGEAKRFLSIYSEYKKAKDVTRQRLYLETMEDVYGRINKVLVDGDQGGKSVLPYLPLSELKPGSVPAKSSAGTSPATTGSATSATGTEVRP
jgi:membrane protease subunit HflK